MLNIRIAVDEFRNPDIFVVDKQGRFSGILGDYYHQIYNQLNWNITYLNTNFLNKKGDGKKFDNDDLMASDLVNKNMVDLYFKQVQVNCLSDQKNIRLSPIVSSESVRLLQCIHRKDTFNHLDVLAGLKNLPFEFWFKLLLIFVCLSIIMIGKPFLKRVSYQDSFKKCINLMKRLKLTLLAFLFCMRILTRQGHNRRIYNNLYFIEYLILIVIVLFTFVIHQIMFNYAFLNLKFRNTSYILKNLEQVLENPYLTPCFLENEAVVHSKLTNNNSIMNKLYHTKKDVCFLSDVMSKKNRAKSSERYKKGLNLIFRLILIGSKQYVEYFGYLFCAKYSDFIRTVLKKVLEKELEKEIPLFWYPEFESEENLQAFLINLQASKEVQNEIYFKFAYRILESGLIKFLEIIKSKIDRDRSINECFTNDYRRISFPYRFSALITANFLIVFNFNFLVCFGLLIFFSLDHFISFFKS